MKSKRHVKRKHSRHQEPKPIHDPSPSLAQLYGEERPMREGDHFLIAMAISAMAVWFVGGFGVFLLWWLASPGADSDSWLRTAFLCFGFPVVGFIAFMWRSTFYYGSRYSIFSAVLMPVSNWWRDLTTKK